MEQDASIINSKGHGNPGAYCDDTARSFEKENLRAYSLLLRIEILLRECLKKSLESELGIGWRKRLPGQLLTKIKEAQLEENQPHFNFVRLGPLYYLTFGELYTLLKLKLSSAVVAMIGGECVLKQIENILSPRNAVCHSRPVSLVGLQSIESLYTQIETALTREKLAELIADPDTGITQQQATKSIKTSLLQVLASLPELPAKIQIAESYNVATIQFWWADDTIAGFDRACIESAIAICRNYNDLPAGVGSAGIRQNFCEDHNMNLILQNAILELDKVKI